MMAAVIELKCLDLRSVLLLVIVVLEPLRYLF
jgi:hypothetical protein